MLPTERNGPPPARGVLAILLGTYLVAGCAPEGAGSITVNRQDPAVRKFKTIEDAGRRTPGKRPRPARP